MNRIFALVGFNPELENHLFGVLQKHRNGELFLFVYSFEQILMNNLGSKPKFA